MTEATGRCLCGAVRYAYDEAHVLWRQHCHCESCRRATAAPMTTFFGVANGHWRWTGAPPQVFVSSVGVERRFCRTCGTQMSYSADRFPGEMHFYAATLDEASAFRPEGHVHWQEKLPWMHLSDDLPRQSASSVSKTD